MAKGKGKVKAQKAKQATQNPPLPSQCATLDEDEITRCNLSAEDGFPRCKVHQEQYRIMYVKYKEAGKFVDKTKAGREMPAKERIAQYTDLHSTLNKARWIREYLEAIRVERAGRHLHQKRFFAKADDGHKIRLKVLEKQMVQAVETLDAIQARAYDLHMANDPAREWVKSFQTAPLSPAGDEEKDFFSNNSILSTIESDPQNDELKQHRAAIMSGLDTSLAAADLIDIELRAQKARILHAFEFVIDEKATFEHIRQTLALGHEPDSKMVLVVHHTLAQYHRRIVMHDPVLSLKAIDKVSFKDLILDEEFSLEDIARFAVLIDKQMGFGLLWWKDSLIEAMAIIRNKATGTAANVGDPKNRFKILGGWVFNTPHFGTMSNEMWGTLLQSFLAVPANIENRFVRLCNTYDDLVAFLSFGALGMYPLPTFCSHIDKGRNGAVPRNHLSLSGVVVADMITGEAGPIGPIPTPRKGRSPGTIIWVEMEHRAHLFGAVRNEPDAVTNAFIAGLRSRPDLFQVALHSDSDSGQKVQCFGSGNEALPAIRMRTFEAPPVSSRHHPFGCGEWEVAVSASDRLFGTNPALLGYLTILTRPGNAGWFFRFKKMPVKYFVILDTVPHRHHSILARNVAWVAFCVQGFGEGEYSDSKYVRASNRMFNQRAEERLSWLPKDSWSTTEMEED
ncbi:hypothetical protein J3R30DRAFT_1566854 [Lentinula aciculospora]|uniref:Uncharacterized protein n=1 Tax=Lentinula aciculospora TaxID=153920 RepID=A0A9W9DHK8_9AGAR|nr:hypothetical protein J3R30DRAFT_1566854 [Lentinula aciculospora]